MAERLLLGNEVSDLCIGKPALRPLPATAAVATAISLLRRDSSLSVWASSTTGGGCGGECVGSISILDILCFICRDDNVCRPFEAIHSPVCLLLEEHKKKRGPFQVLKILDPNSSLLEVVDCILEGAHSLIVPKRRQKLPQRPSLGSQFCWITQEDVIRFCLNSINHFSPMASQSIQSLNIIEDEILQVHYDCPALSALSAINTAHTSQSAVAVVDNEGRLVGEISLHTLACCDETVAPAVATLSAGDLLAYIDYGGPPEDLVRLVKQRLKARNLNRMLDLLEENHSNSSSSSDDEAGSLKHFRHRSNSGGFVRGTEPIVCHPGSSLVAVMIQALAHRLNYVWVIEQDYSLVGIVTFAGMLKVFRDRVPSYS